MNEEAVELYAQRHVGALKGGKQWYKSKHCWMVQAGSRSNVNVRGEGREGQQTYETFR